MISVYCWHQEQKTGSWLDVGELHRRKHELCSDACILWIDLEAPTPEEEAIVFQEVLPIHPLTLEDITRIRGLGQPHLPKVEEFKDYLFVCANPLDENYWKACRAASDDGAGGDR